MSSQVVSHSIVHSTNDNANPETSFLMQQQQHQQHQHHHHHQQQHQQQLRRKQSDRHVLHLNNRACVLVLSDSEYSEAIKLYDTALMIHKEQTEEDSTTNDIFEPYSSPSPSLSPSSSSSTAASSSTTSCSNNSIDCSYHEVLDYSCHSVEQDDCEHDFSEYDEDFGDMDWDGKDETDIHNSSIDSQYNNNNNNNNSSSSYTATPTPTPTYWSVALTPATATQPSRAKIPRMTTASRLRTPNYCGQQEYNEDHEPMGQPHYQHQVYSLPIVMEESEWDNAPIQDKTFVLIFNTALCNHLWGMQLMQQYIAATTATPMGNSNTNSNSNSNTHEAVASLAEHCRETLTIAKLLYKLALENSVSFANGVDKMSYVALYNNLSHVLKTLEGYDSAEAQWCDDMLLKAIFWWRDSNHNHQNGGSGSSSSTTTNNNNSSSNQQRSASTTTTGTESNNNFNSPTDLYLEDDAKIIDAFFENVFYRIGVPESIVPAAAA